MKLYTAPSPSGLRVSAFIAEKGIEIPTETLDIQVGETRTDEFLQKNSLGEIPVLELDDGTLLTETLAICRYLEALYPEDPLMGTDPLTTAKVDMWSRRMEQQVMGPIAQVAQHTFTFFADKLEQLPAYAETQKRLQDKRWGWLDAELADGRRYVCDDVFSVADITGMAVLMICQFAEMPVPERFGNVKRWETAMYERSSWAG